MMEKEAEEAQNIFFENVFSRRHSKLQHTALLHWQNRRSKNIKIIQGDNTAKLPWSKNLLFKIGSTSAA